MHQVVHDPGAQAARVDDAAIPRDPPVSPRAVVSAVHPDDPPISPIRGIARILTSPQAMRRVIEMVPSPNNGVTFAIVYTGEHYLVDALAGALYGVVAWLLVRRLLEPGHRRQDAAA